MLLQSMLSVKEMRIPDGSSVFTAEAKAIDLAIDFVNNLPIQTNTLFSLTPCQFYRL